MAAWRIRSLSADAPSIRRGGKGTRLLRVVRQGGIRRVAPPAGETRIVPVVENAAVAGKSRPDFISDGPATDPLPRCAEALAQADRGKKLCVRRSQRKLAAVLVHAERFAPLTRNR